MRRGPGFGRREERPRDFDIILGVEEIEECRVAVPMRVIVPVVKHRDPADHAAITLGQEKFSVGVFIERVLMTIEH